MQLAKGCYSVKIKSAQFNDISPDVYKKYRTLLAMDLVTSTQDNVS